MYFLQTIETKLVQIEEGSCYTIAQDEIFKKVIGDDKYGYVKAYGMMSMFCTQALRDVPYRNRKLK